MKEVLKNSLNEHRQEKEYGWKPIPPKKKPVRKKSEYNYAFVGILIGLSFGILTSILMYRDSQRCNLLLEENKLLKEMLYYRDVNPMETP
jgi:hypothetical protein